MKNFRYNFIVMALAVMALGLFSCADEPDKYEVASGLPSVSYVRCLSTEIQGSNDDPDMHYTNGELVTEASPQSIICLVGKNLRSVYEIYFNDKKGILNSSYITDNTLIVQIPRSVPETVTDKIYMITKDKDTVTYDFHVVIAAPQIISMGNEYAPVGSTQTLTGNYFIDDPGTPLTINFTGADGSMIPAEITNISSDYTQVTFTVPAGAVEGPIYVTSVYGTTKTSFYYKDSRGMLFDFDSNALDNHGWNGHNSTTDDTALSGKFFQFGDGSSVLNGETWDEQHFSFVYWPGSWNSPENYQDGETGIRLTDLADFSDWSNMALKFEMNIPSEYPWKNAAMQICFAGVDKVTFGAAGVDIYGKTVAGANNTYMTNNANPRALYRPWSTSTTGSYDTGGEWVTVTLPIAANFVYGWDGSVSSGTLTAESFTSLWIFVSSCGVEGVDCTPIIKIDNIRVVPNK